MAGAEMGDRPTLCNGSRPPLPYVRTNMEHLSALHERTLRKSLHGRVLLGRLGNDAADGGITQ